MGLSGTHIQYLTSHAISTDVMEQHEIRSEGDVIVFPWRDGDLVTEQRRPWPGDGGQYYWEKGKELHFWNLRDAGPRSPVLLVEGTKQSLAAASHAPGGFSVLGMAGCEGWSKCDLSRFEDREVYMGLDADAGSNLSVYEAGALFAAEVEFYEARVRFLWLPARGSAGLDDVLAKHPAGRREKFLSYLIGKAGGKPAERKPTTRKGARMDTELPDTGDREGVAVNLDRKLVIDKITRALKDRLDATDLFDYGGVITRLRGHETVPLDKDSFHAQLADAVACYHYTPATDKKPAVFDPRWPDPQTVGAVMSKASDFSPLRRVVRVPFMRPDGTVCSTAGYDRDTATVLVLRDLVLEETEDEPSREDAARSAAFLMEGWLGDFPFETDADRANALALLLTPFVRGLVPLVPLAVVNGLEAGVGKNLLADCISLLATGEAAMPLPWVSNEEEMRKQITSSFSGGAELFVFDEAHVVEGAQMARALTSLTYGDRILGVSRIAKFPNSATWMSLGNQVQVNGDMSRRVYFVALKPYGTTLNDRDSKTYRHPDIKLWTSQNRAGLVRAALTVLRGWYAAGSPAWGRGSAMGSFEPWDRLMSSVTAYAGYPQFLTDVRGRRSESDFEASYWAAHLQWAHERFRHEPFTTRQVQEAALQDPSGYEAPPGMEDPGGKSYTRQLGKDYSKHVERRYDGLILTKAGLGHRSTIRWQIRTPSGGMEGTGGNPTPPMYEKNVLQNDTHVFSRGGEQAAPLPSLHPSIAPSNMDKGTATKTGEVLGAASPSSAAPSENPSNTDRASATKTSEVMSRTVSDTSNTDRVSATKTSRVLEGSALGFDLESSSARQLWAGGHQGPFLRLGGTVREDGQTVLTTDMSALLEDLGGAKIIYGHNILGFDLLALARHCGADYDALAAKAVDTMVLARLADPPGAKGTKPWGQKGYYGLDAVAQRLGHTGKSDDLKALVAEHGGFDRVPVGDERYRAYLQGDLAATQHVYGAQGFPGAYASREMRKLALLNRMTLNGWAVDTDLLSARVAEEEERRLSAVAALHSEFGMPVEKVTYRVLPRRDWTEPGNRSVKAVRRYTTLWPEAAVARGFAAVKREQYTAPWATDAGRDALEAAFYAAGAAFVPRTASGVLALGKDALGDGHWVNAKKQSVPGMRRECADKPGVVRLCELLERATGASAKYAEIQRYVTAQGRVHAGLSGSDPDGKTATATDQASGRFAMSKPSLTNLGKRGPKVEQRRPLVADPGHVLIPCDLSQVDMRGVAALSQDKAYMALFEPGKDAHMDMAEVYFGERTKEARDKTKAINHGLNYGQAAYAVASRNRLDLGLVERAVAARAEAFPRLIEWTDEVRELGASGALLDNGFGRLMRCDPERAYTQAPALMGQGAARDIMCESLLRLAADRPDATPYLRGVVHDEVILSVPAGEAEGWRGALKRAFTWEWRGVPILCEVGRPGKSWADCAD